ncbi:MAG: hypothetical protein H6Q90_1420 [Deltaproteobacteria bacterium]|nr:hypothetical protein [Deltaproteobacteria bacterium]
MRMRTLILMVLVPTLVNASADAAPRPKKKPAKPAKNATTKPVDASTEPTTPEPVPDPKPTTATPPSVAPASTNPATPAGGGGPGTGGGGGAGGGSGDAAKAEATDKSHGDEPDVDSLRQEYLALRDELFKSRARANAVASQLYSTRIQVKLTYTTARYYNPAKATIRLDGASVYENATGGISGDDGVRFDGYVAPGRHLLTFRVEATGKDDDTFTSVTETQIVVKAVAGKDLVVAARAHDSGDIAYEWKRKERGSYGLGIDVGVKTTPRAAGSDDGDAKPAAPKGKK